MAKLIDKPLFYVLSEDSTNIYLNDNWKPVSEALKPIIKKTIENILLGVLNRIFHFIPAEYFLAGKSIRFLILSFCPLFWQNVIQTDIPHPSELYGEL